MEMEQIEIDLRKIKINNFKPIMVLPCLFVGAFGTRIINGVEEYHMEYIPIPGLELKEGK